MKLTGRVNSPSIIKRGRRNARECVSRVLVCIRTVMCHLALLPAARLLLRSGKPLKIGSRAFDLLSVLCQHAGEVVSKENLIDTVWNGVVVEETNLRVHIAALRRVLGDGRGAQRYLVSVPLRGYSLVAPVTTEGGAQVTAAAPAAARLRKVRRFTCC